MRLILAILLICTPTFADTPSPSQVQSKTYSGDGTTAIGHTGNALNVDISGPVTQGSPPWSFNLTQYLSAAMSVTNPAAVQISNGTAFVDPTQIRHLNSGVDSVAISGSITATNPSVSGTGAAAPAFATQIGGSDGANLRAAKVSAAGLLSVDGSAVTQPISAASLPLPTGAATSVLQGTGNSTLSTIAALLAPPLAVTGPLTNAQLRASDIGVTVSSSALPSGASTSALQSTANTYLSQINANLTPPLAVTGTFTATNPSVSTNGTAIPSSSTQIGGSDGTNLRPVKVSSAGVVSVDGSAVTQPVSAASLPLPAGAATSALQTSGNASLSSIDSKLTSPLNVAQFGSWTTARTWTLANATDSVAAVQAGPWTVTANIGTPGSLALDATASRSQGSVGGGVAGTFSTLVGGVYNTTPPVLTNGQQSSLQFDSSGNLKTSGTSTISGAITSNQGTSPWVENVSQFGGSNVVTGTGASGSGIPRVTVANDSNILATQSGAWTTGRTWNLSSGSDSVNVGNFPATYAATQSTSPWVENLTQLAGAAFSATNYLPARITNGTSYVDPTQIRALTSADVVSAVQSGTWNINNVSGTISLPTGASTSALQTSGNASLSSIDSKVPALGQALAAASVPVVLTAAQLSTLTPLSTVAVTQSTSPWIVSGTVTSNIGTTNGLALDATVSSVQGSASGGTAATKSDLAGGIYNSTPPTLTNGQQASLQFDSSGNLKTSGTSTITGSITANQGTSPWVDNITQFGGSNVVTGTGASGSGIPRVTVSNDSNILATQSGSWTTGRTWTLSNGTDSVNVGNFPATQSVTQGTSPWVTTANIGTTGGLALDTSVNGLLVAQGSTTSGQFGPLTQGAVTTAAPTYTTAQTSPLSLTTAGALRTDSSATTQPVSGTVTANAGSGTFTVAGTVTANQGGNWNINNITGTVSLPTGASTSANQTTANASLSSIDSKVPALGQALAAGSVPVVLTAAQLSTLTPLSTVAVTQSTSPWVVSGTVTSNIGTTNGLALDATLTNLQGSASGGTAAAKSSLSGGIYNSTPPTLTNGQQASLQFDSSGNLKTAGTSTITGTITSNQGTSPWVENVSQFGGSNVVTGTGASGAGIPRVTVSNDSNILATQSGTWNINNITGTVSLPTGAATSANQTTANTSLSSIDSKIPALGQALAAASVPVVLTAAQLSTLTPLSTVAVTQSTSPWFVSGTVTSNIGTTNGLALDATVSGLQVSQGSTTSGQNGGLILGAVTTAAPTYTTAQSNPLSLTTAGALRTDSSATTQPVSGTLTCNAGTGTLNVSVQNASIPVTQSGTWTTGRTWNLSSGADSVAAAQSGSWTVTANAGTNLNTSLLQLDTTGAKLNLAQASTTSGQTGPLIQGAVTTAAPSYTTAQTSPLSLTTAGALRTDASGTTQPVSGSLGRTWTLASGTDSVSAVQSGAWNITNISGTVSLPTGASTSALQTTGNSSLSSIDSKVPALGQALAAASVPVVLTAAQISTLTPLSTVAVTQSTSPWVVSGTVTSNIGTTNGLALDATVSALQVSQGSTTSGQKGGLMLGAVTTAAPTYTTAQSSPLSLTTAGALRTDASATTQPVSGTLTCNAGTGTLNVSVQNASLPVTQSGTWNINNISGTISLPTGASTSAKQPALGTAGTASADVITVQGIASMTALKVDGSAVTQPVSGTVTANIGTTNGLALDATLTNVQGTVAAGTAAIKSFLTGAVFNTVAPTLTNGQQAALQLDSSGNLKTTGTATVSGTVASNITQFGGTNVSTGTGASGAGIPRVTVANDSNVLVTQSTSPWVEREARQFQSVLSNATITSTGSNSITLDVGPNKFVIMVLSISNSPTGTTPTITFTLNDIDDITGNIVGAGTASSTYNSAVTNQMFTRYTQTGKLQLNYTVTGSSPSFTGVNLEVIAGSGNTIIRNSSATELATSSNPIRIDPTGTTTQPVSGTVSTKTALTANSPTAATVGTSSAQAVASNGSRKGLILTNTSANKISIGIGASAVLNSGITLNPGAVWYMDEYSLATGAINAIASAASSNLAIQEFQ